MAKTKPRPLLERQQRTSFIIWLAAIICSIVTVIVILIGIAVLAAYFILRPRIPTMSVAYAHLDRLDYDQQSVLGTQITMNVAAQNENTGSHVSFSNLVLDLYCHGALIAKLKAEDFDVMKNSTSYLPYVINTSGAYLLPGSVADINDELQKSLISFNLKGSAHTRWNLGAIRSVKFYTHLQCSIQFFIPSFNGSSKLVDCNSKIS